ncbi:MAG: 16S rRNA (cytosine(1402)-N(4))-methyltransferase RsmH [Patescibacteria group bacterium]
MTVTVHQPVMKDEVIAAIRPKVGDVIVDATVNAAGHGEALCGALGHTGWFIGIDADARAINLARPVLAGAACRFDLVVENFRHLDHVLDRLKAQPRVIFFDLGLSSDQLEVSGRGFSFQRNEPLLMTFHDHVTEADLTAADVVNTWREATLADVIYAYGEEKFARRIAAAIVAARRGKLFQTTFDLVTVIKEAVPDWYTRRRLHFATKTFQALRIAVNDELGSLRLALNQAWRRLQVPGLIALLTFHGLEARVVKNFVSEHRHINRQTIRLDKPIVPSRAEILLNPRSRSAVLRLIHKLQ